MHVICMHYMYGDNTLFSKIESKLRFYFMLLRRNLHRRGVAQDNCNTHLIVDQPV